MIPLRLQISGFLSYREAVDIDLSHIQLACISGSNGAGKSSLLDAMTWALFGEARRRDDSIIHSAKEIRGAEVILDFAYENLTYRIRRYKPKEKAGLLEFSIQTPEGEWKALTEATTRQTEARIRQTLRLDYDTFINASFFLQGKADQFAQQKVAGRKKILGSILGLEKWETYRISAATLRKERESNLENKLGEAKAIQDELAQEAERKAALKQMEENLQAAAALRETREKQVETLRRLAATLDEQHRLVEMLAGQVNAAEESRQELIELLETRQQEQQNYQVRIKSARETEKAFKDWQAARVELEAWEGVAARFREADARRAAPLMTIETARTALVTEQRALHDQKERATADTLRLKEVDGALKQAQTELALLENRLAEKPALELKRDGLKEKNGTLQSEKAYLKTEMNTLKERIEGLRAASGVECPLCGQDLEPDDREKLIRQLEKQGKEMGDQFRENTAAIQTNQEEIGTIEADLRTLGEAEADRLRSAKSCSQLEEQLATLRSALADWEKLGKQRLAQVEKELGEDTYAAEARASLDALNGELKELGYDAAAHDATRRKEMTGRESELEMRALEAARAALTPLEREIEGLKAQLETSGMKLQKQKDALSEAEAKLEKDSADLPDMAGAETELLALRERENQLRQEMGAARQRVEVLKNIKAKLKDLEGEQDGLRLEIARLKTLERAFGKDGIPALLIEQALPEIEAHANEILDRLSGGALNVRFLTQRDFKNKHRDDKREALDIIISDANGEREYELYSGGEAFRINFAIRLALSRVLAHRAGARLQTLVIDEGFGSQDAEGRQKLIEAINQVRPDFALILVITHLEELKDAFSARIEVEKTNTGSQVRVVTA